MFYVYMLRCSDGSYYVGQTDDLERRMSEHKAGGCRHTASRLPIVPVHVSEHERRDEALAAERRLKGSSRAKKEALISGVSSHDRPARSLP